MKEVATTYTTWERVGKPFYEDGKYYIVVINPKTNKEKTVRWYGEIMPDYKHLLGFDNGYIIIFNGITKDNREFFAQSNARYAWFFGWYVVSTEDVPTNLPEGVTPIRVDWQDEFNNVNKRYEIIKSKITIYEE